MSTTFPTTIDSYTTITCNTTTDPKDIANNLQDAVTALEMKVGVNSSAVTTTIDYLLKSTSSSNPGHKHTLANGATDVTATASEVNRAAGVTAGTVSASKNVVADSTLSVNSLGIFGPEANHINLTISRTVTSNNLTLAIKTASAGDPSATDPVHVRIGNTLRHITAALSVVKNAGTNWCNAGSTELATNEIDYFVYLIWNTNLSAVMLGFSRIPYAITYADFSSTTTNEKYIALSTGTAPASTDQVEVVGRFNATLSATASFNWSVPATSVILNRPVFKTRALSASASAGGFSATTVNEVVYTVDGSRVTGDVRIVGTSNATSFTAVMPFTSDATFRDSAGAGRDNGTSIPVLGEITGSGTTLTLQRYISAAAASPVTLSASFTNSGDKRCTIPIAYTIG